VIYTDDYIPKDLMDDEELEELEALEKFKIDEQLEKLTERVQNHLDWAKNSTGRKKAEARWRDAWNFWCGRQWDGIQSFGIRGRDAARKSMKPCPVDNFFKAQIEGIVGDICDSPVDIILSPTEPSGEELVLAYQAAVKHVLRVNRFERQRETIVRNAELYGPMLGKVYWDSEWVGGYDVPFVGEVQIVTISPENLFIDPRVKATDPLAISCAEFIIYAVKRSLSYIRKRYPENGHKVQADTYAGYLSTINPEQAEGAISPEDMSVLLIEYWYTGEPIAPNFPMDLEYEPFTDNTGKGVHVAVVAGGVLLEHKTYVYPKYPFAIDWLYPNEESGYGYSDAHDMLLPQLILNKLNEIGIEGHSIHSVGNWVTDEGNIRNPQQFQKFATTGGAILPVVDASRMKRELGGGVSGSLFNHYNQEQRAMEAVSGRIDITQGRAPRGIRAASAIALLLQQAAGRIRQRSRSVASYVEQVIDLVIMNIGHFYTDERLIRVDGIDDKPKWLTVTKDSFVRYKNYVDLNGNQIQEEFIPQFDIIVNVGSETPTSKVYYAELATQLYDRGIIDEIALLEVLDFPRWRQALERRKKAEQEAMQQQMQASAMQNNAGGGVIPQDTPINIQSNIPETPVANPINEPVGMPTESVQESDTATTNIPPELLEQLMLSLQGVPRNPSGAVVGTADDDELMQLVALIQQLQMGRTPIT